MAIQEATFFKCLRTLTRHVDYWIVRNGNNNFPKEKKTQLTGNL